MPVNFIASITALTTVVAIHTKESGLDILGWNVNLWRLMIINAPRPPLVLLLENLGFWALTFGLAHACLYMEPGRTLFRPLKFNKDYPPAELVQTEVARCIGGVLVATAYEAIINAANAMGTLPLFVSDAFRGEPTDRPEWGGLFSIILGASVLLFVGDAHFYFTHRWMHHSPWLYKNVHAVHHKSHNPDPFSGLSMHPIEHLIYFSADLICALVLPLWLARLSVKSHILFPLAGHCGVGLFSVRSSCNHYIHHAKFNCEYGAGPFWDWLLGTQYIPGVSGPKLE
jgi:sterol desaturase/sphingolipid hydroxylase (fatty acid hydroxylase superfamily)